MKKKTLTTAYGIPAANDLDGLTAGRSGPEPDPVSGNPPFELWVNAARFPFGHPVERLANMTREERAQATRGAKRA